MRIALDISRLHQANHFRGIGSYVRLLFQALQEHDGENSYILAKTPAQAQQADLIHYPYFDLFFHTLPLIKTKPTVVTIHDVIPLVFSKHYPPGIKGWFNLQLQKRSLASVSAIVCDSDASGLDVISYLGQPKNKVTRVYLSPNPQLRPPDAAEVKKVLKKYALTKPYFLYVGDINYNKNLPTLIRSFAPFAADYDLVLVSKALASDIPEAQEIRSLIAGLKLQPHIKMLTDVPLEPITELASLYTGAFWYIQPSLYEGFGLPVLEAMACQTPVLSSTGGSLPELVGSSAILFDPSSTKALTTALAQAISLSAQQRQAYIDQGTTTLAQFSWKKTTAEMNRIYAAAL